MNVEENTFLRDVYHECKQNDLKFCALGQLIADNYSCCCEHCKFSDLFEMSSIDDEGEEANCEILRKLGMK